MSIQQNGMFDTITAISTPVGSGGIGIVRISGDKAISIGNAIFKGKRALMNCKSHTMNYGHIVDTDGQIVDEVMVCVMKKPNTYTKEDVVEINCHGGIRSVESVLSVVSEQGARLAEPGEFTKRAFLNGRIDLSQAEAVIDVINSKTDLSRKVALNQLKGGLSAKCKTYANEVLTMIAHIEASIDYPEHDLEEMNLFTIQEKAVELIQNIKKLIGTENKGRIIREGIETAIIGCPNVGKSSLLNYLLDEDRAIVTDIPGTTRDVLQEFVNIHGIPLKMVDTAGIRLTEDIIEQMGVEKSKKYAENADLVLMMLDGSRELAEQDIEILQLIQNKKAIILINKADLEQKLVKNQLLEYIDLEHIVSISLKTGEGIESLYQKIKDLFYDGEIEMSDETFVYNIRHKNALQRSVTSLEAAIQTIEMGLSEDFVSIDLQEGYKALGEVTGETLEEDIIDKIFKEFCLGK